MKIEFDAKKHQYFINGNYVGASVTQLLRKHNLAPNYSGVSEEVLKAKAEIGTAIHKDLECVLTKKGYKPESVEGENFDKYVKKYIDSACAEQMLGLNYKGLLVAGTADVIGFLKKDDTPFIADHKTTININKEYVSWQTSLLDYMLRHLNGETINGRKFNWTGAKKLFCFHYTKEGELVVVELDKIPDEEIERLLEAEYKGEIYQRRELVIDDETQMGIEMVSNTIKEMETRLKKMKEQQDKYKEIILNAMKEQGIKSFENDTIKITYVDEITKLSVDSTKVKKDYPMVYEQCLKKTIQKPSLRITIKGADNED